MVKGKLSHR